MGFPDMEAAPNAQTVTAIAKPVEKGFISTATHLTLLRASHRSPTSFNISEDHLVNQLPQKGTQFFSSLPFPNLIKVGIRSN